jgi:ribosomal protein S18 acetylase RimI-like enzyme
MHVVDPAIRIRASQIELLGRVLTEAYYDDPAVAYIFPDAHTRRAVLTWFFTSVAIRTSRLCGETYTTANVDGGALWISPGMELTIGHAVRTEIPSLPLKVDRSSVIRWISFNGYLESVRKHKAVDHWYLLALGTEPSTTGHGIRRALMAPVLAAADWDLRSCYVETFREADLPFYEQSGFQVVGAGQIPDGGPDFWLLIRPPRRVAERAIPGIGEFLRHGG